MTSKLHNRIQVAEHYSLLVFSEGRASFAILDKTDDTVICRHHFSMPVKGGPLDHPEWFKAQRTIAEAIASAINSAPDAAIEYIRKTQRDAQQVYDMAAKDNAS